MADSEAHETIERAWKLFQREKRAKHAAALEAKLAAMVDACEELDRVTSGEGAGRHVFERAMARASFSPPENIKGKKGSEARFLEVRLEGMWPRESWVPTETRGKGWNYEWKRPGTGGSVSQDFQESRIENAVDQAVSVLNLYAPNLYDIGDVLRPQPHCWSGLRCQGLAAGGMTLIPSHAALTPDLAPTLCHDAQTTCSPSTPDPLAAEPHPASSPLTPPSCTRYRIPPDADLSG